MGIVEIGLDKLGLEAAGIVRRAGPRVKHLRVGDRVMVFATGGAFATVLRVSESHCVKIPDRLAFDDAATMPIVYITAAYSLFDVGGLRKGQVRRAYLSSFPSRLLTLDC